MRERHNGRQPEGHVLKPDPDVEHDQPETRRKRVDGRYPRVAGNLATDGVGREIDRGLGEAGRHPPDHTAGLVGVERCQQIPGATGLRGCGRFFTREGKLSIPGPFRLQGGLQGAGQRGPRDLLRKHELHRRGKIDDALHGRLRRRARRDFAAGHAIGRHASGEGLLEELLHLVLILIGRVDLEAAVGFTLGKGHRTDRGRLELAGNRPPNFGNR